MTDANVHDTQAAIPMEKLIGRKVQHLYSLMDAAYDADASSTYITEQGRVPLIDLTNAAGQSAYRSRLPRNSDSRSGQRSSEPTRI